MDLGQKTLKRHKTKNIVSKRPNGFRIEDPQRHKDKRDFWQKGLMDLRRNTFKRHKDK